MTEPEINLLSRLAMLKVAGSVGERFDRALGILKGPAAKIGQNIKDDNRNDGIASSLLEWAEHELGIKLDD